MEDNYYFIQSFPGGWASRWLQSKQQYKKQTNKKTNLGCN